MAYKLALIPDAFDRSVDDTLNGHVFNPIRSCLKCLVPTRSEISVLLALCLHSRNADACLLRCTSKRPAAPHALEEFIGFIDGHRPNVA